MNTEVKGKAADLALFALFYAISYAAGWLSAFYIQNMLLRLFVFDVAATVAIYLLSLTIKNSSLYDAYWSLTPFIMLTYLVICMQPLNAYHYIAYAVFSLWSIRLTANWVTTFGGRKWIDWRYRQIKEQNNAFVWQIANFFGIMMMPTLLVFGAFIPMIYAFEYNIGAASLAGDVIILSGTALEFFADRQMHAFLKGCRRGEVIECGLWKYSRHPNYLGEMLVWVGVYFVLFPSVAELWYLFGGALLIIALFNFISVPMAEKRQLSRREAYAGYKERTSRLLILPPKRNKD